MTAEWPRATPAGSLRDALKERRDKALDQRRECLKEGSHAEASMYGHKADAYQNALDLAEIAEEAWRQEAAHLDVRLREVAAAWFEFRSRLGDRWFTVEELLALSGPGMDENSVSRISRRDAEWIVANPPPRFSLREVQELVALSTDGYADAVADSISQDVWDDLHERGLVATHQDMSGEYETHTTAAGIDFVVATIRPSEADHDNA